MNTKTLILAALSTVFATAVKPTTSIESFAQPGCTASYTGKLYHRHLSLDTKCFTPTLSGKCFAYYESYHFDAKTGKCIKSYYGGCGDGCQAFKTEKECVDSCSRASIEPVEPDNRYSFRQDGCSVVVPKNIKPHLKDLPVTCFIKTEPSHCKMGIKSYHFDATTGSCVESLFGGCDTGCLAFKTMEECENSCWRATSDV